MAGQEGTRWTQSIILCQKCLKCSKKWRAHKKDIGWLSAPGRWDKHTYPCFSYYILLKTPDIMYKTNIKQLGKVERRLARDSETQGLTRGEFPGFSLPHIPQTGCWRNQRHRNAGRSDKKAPRKPALSGQRPSRAKQKKLDDNCLIPTNHHHPHTHTYTYNCSSNLIYPSKE